ncbi:response regulator transcription factor [Halobacteriovorax sp.]|uniref:response regulator transcription factor n=1 Tax=Halobacteriovorax sp. TaxID=2020862 RepID=UPI00356A6DB8
MNKKRVFLLDDEQDMLDTITEVLAKEFHVVSEINALKAIEILKTEKFDAILFDINMPIMSGFEVFKEVSRSTDLSTTAVMFLSSITKVETKVEGLELGADDYILKPVLSRELLARVNNRISRLSKETSAVYRHGATRLIIDSQRVETNGALIDLTPTEYKILYTLWKNVGKILTKDQIAQSVWRSQDVEHHTIDTHVSNMRKKLCDPTIEIKVIKARGILLNLRV